jgi:protein TonB
MSMGQQSARAARGWRIAAAIAAIVAFDVATAPFMAALADPSAPPDPIAPADTTASINPSELSPISREPPKYPAGAERRGITGWVLLEFTVDAKGNVIFPRVVQSSPPGIFDSSALQAVEKWRYQPTGREMPGAQVKLLFKL